MSGLFSLSGRKALVTGANTGIGQAVAVALASAGAEVTCAGRRGCDETLAAIVAAGGRGQELHLDFADPMAARDLFDGSDYSILVNNAGIIRRADSTDLSEEDWDAVMDVNLKALFFTTQSFARALLARGEGGSVVNIASLLSFQGGIRVASYTASKHGVAGVTKILANEWAAKGINVNAIGARLHRHEQHRGAARRSGAQSRHPRAHSGRALGRTGRHRRHGGLPVLTRGALYPRHRDSR